MIILLQWLQAKLNIHIPVQNKFTNTVWFSYPAVCRHFLDKPFLLQLSMVRFCSASLQAVGFCFFSSVYLTLLL